MGRLPAGERSDARAFTARNVKRRWRVLIAAGTVCAPLVLVPLAYIEGGCRTPIDGFHAGAAYKAILPPAARRPEARTLLTYPEWHIVYEADAFARHLAAGRPPSAFPYGEQIAGFWTSYCLINRATRDAPAASDAKVMLYTIGVSYTVELAAKAAYERTIGRLFESISGWTSADDRYAAAVQARYGAFMHETPWYRFPFGEALRGTWRIAEPSLTARHWERRVALSAEYGVKAGYAKAIDAATGATLGRDEPTLRLIVRAAPATLAGVDGDLRPVQVLPGGMTVVEAPRYERFNSALAKLIARDVPLVEIAGNDDVFATVLAPAGATLPGTMLFDMTADGDTGRRRLGVVLKVPALPELFRAAERAGGLVEHVHDY